MKSGKIIGTSQDGNREWILLLIAVCAVAIKILLIFIYQRDFKDL